MSEQNKSESPLPFNLHSINGIPFEPFVTQRTMDELKDWRVLPDDIYVVTYPKSGTSWTKQIVKLIKSNGVDEVPTSSSSVAADEFMPWMEEAGMEKCLVIIPERCSQHMHFVSI